MTTSYWITSSRQWVAHLLAVCHSIYSCNHILVRCLFS
jgi:hypothetical protein